MALKDLGTAKTEKFMLSTAEVRIGAVGELQTLNSDDSIGLVKNVTITGEMEATTLGQGVQNRSVYSIITSSTLNVSTEVYEYTAQNLAYGLGLSGAVSDPVATTADAAVTGDDSVVAISVASETGITAGDYVLIETNKGVMNNLVASVAAGEVTVTTPIPTGVTIANGAAVVGVNDLDLGDPEDIYYSAAIVGKLVDGTDVMFNFPKVKIIRGFNVQFGTSDYGNMPFEMEPYSLVTSDSDFAEYGCAQGKLFI